MLALLISALIHPAAASTSSTFSIPIDKTCYTACSDQATQEHKSQRLCYAPCAKTEPSEASSKDDSSSDSSPVSEDKGYRGSNSGRDDGGGFVSERK